VVVYKKYTYNFHQIGSVRDAACIKTWHFSIYMPDLHQHQSNQIVPQENQLMTIIDK